MTRRALAGALKHLMGQRPLQSITVGDICDACHMNRKSFYYHFRDKYDLVTWIFHHEFFEEWLNKPGTDSDELLNLCRFLESDKGFYRAALRVEGQNSLHDDLADVLMSILSERVMPCEDRRFFLQLYVHVYMAAIAHWVTDGCQVPAERFVELMYHAGEKMNCLAAG